MMGLIMSILGIALAAAAIGAIIGIIIIVPTTIYCIPYYCWLGSNEGKNGVPARKDQTASSKKGHIWLECKNATKVYRSWITKKPHGITKF